MDTNLIKQIQKVIKPLVKLFLRFGLSYKVLDKIIKETFVTVSTSNYGTRGREANTSKIAFMTGLSRKEVSNIKQNIKQEKFVTLSSLSFSEKKMNIWLNDKDFINSHNQPKALVFEGTGNSFVELIRKARIDITPKTAYFELLRLDLIDRNEKDKIILRYYKLINQSNKELLTTELEDIINKK